MTNVWIVKCMRVKFPFDTYEHKVEAETPKEALAAFPNSMSARLESFNHVDEHCTSSVESGAARANRCYNAACACPHCVG